jgi:hypothetical protein
MIEHRQVPRTRCLREGRIVFNNRNSVLTCMVRDMGANGVRVTLDRADTVPEAFEFQYRGKPLGEARRVWVNVNELGISFA